MPDDLTPDCHRRGELCPQERRIRELEHENKAHHNQFDRVLAEIRAGNARQAADASEFRNAIAQQKRELEGTRHRLWGNGQPGEMQGLATAIEDLGKEMRAGFNESRAALTKLAIIIAGGAGTGFTALGIIQAIFGGGTPPPGP